MRRLVLLLLLSAAPALAGEGNGPYGPSGYRGSGFGGRSPGVGITTYYGRAPRHRPRPHYRRPHHVRPAHPAYR